MIVVDASAALDALAADRPSAQLLRRVSEEPWHAPHLIDLEVLNGLRHLVARGQLSIDLAASVRLDFSAIPVTRYAHAGLRDRIWELRSSMTAYDAVYVALAEALDVPLVTTDARLGRVPGSRCAIEVFGQLGD